MLKNHSMQVKMVKDQNSTVVEKHIDIDPEKINKIVKESVKNAAIGIVAVVGSLTLIKTASTIAINYAPKN